MRLTVTMANLPALLSCILLAAFTQGKSNSLGRGLSQKSNGSSNDSGQFNKVQGSAPGRVSSHTLLQMIKQAYRDWETYKGLHSKKFADKQVKIEHMLEFLSSLRQARQHNEAYARGEVSFELDPWNSLADLPFAEYMQRNGYRQPLDTRPLYKNSSLFLTPMNAGSISESVDWRDHGYVTKVKDQGQCGSCWAFSATGSVEGQHKRATGVLVSLSEQNLIDCSSAYVTRGCHGGWVDSAFEYIRDNRGIDLELYYPYHELEVERCMFYRNTIGAVITGYMDVKPGDENALKVAVATQGPVSVIIDASQKSFQLYKSGVYNEKNCSSEALNHAVLAVGYGTDPVHGDYWLVKNSWGDDWGDAGYIRMARNNNNQCGIASKASFPLI